MANHERLHVWHRSQDFALAVHRALPAVTWRGAPGLKSQILRAASSIPANIAEGAAHQTDAHFAHFVSMAIGSANELESHLRLAAGLSLISSRLASALLGELDQIRRMLIGLRTHLTTKK